MLRAEVTDGLEIRRAIRRQGWKAMSLCDLRAICRDAGTPLPSELSRRAARILGSEGTVPRVTPPYVVLRGVKSKSAGSHSSNDRDNKKIRL